MAIEMGINKKGHPQAYVLYEGEDPSMASECCCQCGCCHTNNGEGTMCPKCVDEFNKECEHDELF